MLPHVGQATSLSWVWLRMCSRKRYLILKKASQPARARLQWTLLTCQKRERASFNMCLSSRTIPLAEESLLLLCKRLLLSAFNVIVHMTVEPLRIVKWTLYKGGHMWSLMLLSPTWSTRRTTKQRIHTYITVLPQASKSFWSFRKKVVAVQALVAAGQIGVGREQLWANELEFSVVVVKVGMDLQFCRATHGQKLTAFPETSILI